MAEFTGKNVLVLGGSRGIGAAIVRRFVKGGAKVSFTYAGSKEASEALAGDTGAEAIRTDSANRDELIRTVAGRGPIDVLVANAGVAVAGNPLEIEPDVIDHMIDVNVRGPYHAAVEAARTMPDNGRIIVIGSVNGDTVPVPGFAGYALTKSAVQGMVRGLARDFGARGITVNAIQPGPVDTDMNPAQGPMAGMMHSFMAIKRHIDADEIAEFAAYLAGPNGAMITGALHTIDGGFGA